jgi:hypothetical protein
MEQVHNALLAASGKCPCLDCFEHEVDRRSKAQARQDLLAAKAQEEASEECAICTKMLKPSQGVAINSGGDDIMIVHPDCLSKAHAWLYKTAGTALNLRPIEQLEEWDEQCES